MMQQPFGWTTTLLGGFGKWGSGGTPKRTEQRYFAGGTIPWLVIGDLNDAVVTSAATHITPAAIEESSAKLVPAGTLLIAMYGSIGKTGIAGIPCATNQAIATLQTYPDLDHRYVYRMLQWLRPRLVEQGKGGAQQNISQEVLKSQEAPVAPLAEQRRIADKLDTVLARVDSVNDRLARVAPLLKRFRQSVLAAAMSGELTTKWREQSPPNDDAAKLHAALLKDHEDAGGHGRGNASDPTKEAHDLIHDDLPGGWQVALLKDCCAPGRPITYGILKPGPELDHGIPYVRVADFPGNRLNLRGIKRTSPEIDAQYKRARLASGDLLLSIRGSVGRVIEIPPELHGANITQDTARLSISARLCSRFIFLALLAPSTQRRMANAVRGVAVRGINIGDVRALQIPLPALEEQVEIVRRVDLLFAYADRLEARLQAAQTAAERLTPALLAKAFRGELVPQDPNDEPASELLKRLTASRAAAPKAQRGRAASKT